MFRERGEPADRRHQQIRIGALIRAPHAAAQLIQLRQPEAIRAIDDDRVRPRNIEPVLDDRGAHQHVRLAANEFQHHFLEIGFVHLPVADDHARLRHQPLDQRRHRSDRFHAVVHEEDLPVARQLFFDRALDDGFRKRRHRRLNRQPVFRRRLDHRHIAQSHQRHMQRPRNRRSRHRQHVHVLAHFLDALFVRHAEALLFVHHQQPEILKFHVFRKQPVRPDHDIHSPGFDLRQNVSSARAPFGSG